jgi:hypothetical protein
MATRGVQILEFDELHALHRALVEARFSEHVTDTALCGSPFVASVANRVFAALIEAEREAGNADRARQWELWRQVTPDRREWIVSLSRITPDGLRRRWSIDQKKEFVELLLSPFTLTDDLLERFVAEADRRAEP